MGQTVTNREGKYLSVIWNHESESACDSTAPTPHIEFSLYHNAKHCNDDCFNEYYVHEMKGTVLSHVKEIYLYSLTPQIGLKALTNMPLAMTSAKHLIKLHGLIYDVLTLAQQAVNEH